jgi:hypothetical protein
MLYDTALVHIPYITAIVRACGGRTLTLMYHYAIRNGHVRLLHYLLSSCHPPHDILLRSTSLPPPLPRGSIYDDPNDEETIQRRRLLSSAPITMARTAAELCCLWLETYTERYNRGCNTISSGAFRETGYSTHRPALLRIHDALTCVGSKSRFHVTDRPHGIAIWRLLLHHADIHYLKYVWQLEHNRYDKVKFDNNDQHSRCTEPLMGVTRVMEMVSRHCPLALPLFESWIEKHVSLDMIPSSLKWDGPMTITMSISDGYRHSPPDLDSIKWYDPYQAMVVLKSRWSHQIIRWDINRKWASLHKPNVEKWLHLYAPLGYHYRDVYEATAKVYFNDHTQIPMVITYVCFSYLTIIAHVLLLLY